MNTHADDKNNGPAPQGMAITKAILLVGMVGIGGFSFVIYKDSLADVRAERAAEEQEFARTKPSESYVGELREVPALSACVTDKLRTQTKFLPGSFNVPLRIVGKREARMFRDGFGPFDPFGGTLKWGTATYFDIDMAGEDSRAIYDFNALPGALIAQSLDWVGVTVTLTAEGTKVLYPYPRPETLGDFGETCDAIAGLVIAELDRVKWAAQ